MKPFGIVLMAGSLMTATAHAAVEVTCVCSTYLLDRTGKLALEAEELYTTTQMRRVRQCNNSSDNRLRAKEIDNEKYFNCKAIAKEDLRSE